jgi:hypothetical protein
MRAPEAIRTGFGAMAGILSRPAAPADSDEVYAVVRPISTSSRGSGMPRETVTLRNPQPHFGVPIPAFEIALLDEHVARRVRTLIVESPEEPVPSPRPATNRRKARR